MFKNCTYACTIDYGFVDLARERATAHICNVLADRLSDGKPHVLRLSEEIRKDSFSDVLVLTVHESAVEERPLILPPPVRLRDLAITAWGEVVRRLSNWWAGGMWL